MAKPLAVALAALLALATPAQSVERAVDSGAAPAIRGITIGPIENALHPDKGYGSEACARAMLEARRTMPVASFSCPSMACTDSPS